MRHPSVYRCLRGSNDAARAFVAALLSLSACTEATPPQVDTGELRVGTEGLPNAAQPSLRIVRNGAVETTLAGPGVVTLEVGTYTVEADNVVVEVDTLSAPDAPSVYVAEGSEQVRVLKDQTVEASVPFVPQLVSPPPPPETVRAHPLLVVTPGIGLDADQKTNPKTQEAFVQYDSVVTAGAALSSSLYWVSSTRGLMDVLDINVRMDGDFSFGSVDASFDFQREVRFDEFSLSWIAVTEGSGPTIVTRNVVPSEEAKHLALNDYASFRTKFGTHFASQISTEYKVAVIFTVGGVTSSERTEFRSAAGYSTSGPQFGAMSINGSVEQQIREWANDGRLNVRVLATVGGGIEDIPAIVSASTSLWPVPQSGDTLSVDPSQLSDVLDGVKQLIPFIQPVPVEYKFSPWTDIFPTLPIWQWRRYPVEWELMYDRYAAVVQRYALLGRYITEASEAEWAYIPAQVVADWQAQLAGYTTALAETDVWAEACRTGTSCEVPTSLLPEFTRREDVRETARAVTFYFDGSGLDTNTAPESVQLELLNSRNETIAVGAMSASVGQVTLDVVPGREFVINADAVGNYVLRVTAPFEVSTDTLTWAPLLLSGYAFYTSDETSTVYQCLALEFGDSWTNLGFVGAAGADSVVADLSRITCDSLELRRALADYLDASGLERYWDGKRIDLQYVNGDIETFYNWTERLDLAPPIFHPDGRVQFPYTAVNVERKLGSLLKGALPQPPVSGVVEGWLESAGDVTRFEGLQDTGESQCLRGRRFAPDGPYHCGRLLVEWLSSFTRVNPRS